MKNKTKLQKFIALFSAMMLLVTSLGLQVFAQDETTIPEPTGYTTVLGVDDFVGSDATIWDDNAHTWSGALETISAGAGTLDGVLVDGVYNISRYAAVQIGSRDRYRFHIGVNNPGTGLVIQFVDPTGKAYGGETLALEDLRCPFSAQDMRVKVGFSFTTESETATNGDLLIRVWIGDLFYREIEAENMPIAGLTRDMLINTGNGSGAVTLKKASDELTVLTAKDFLNGETEKTVASGSQESITAGTGNLDNVAIEGTFNIQLRGIVQMGSAQINNQTRLQIQAYPDATWRFMFVRQIGSAVTTYGSEVNHTQEEVGYNVGTDMPVKVEFLYANRDYVTNVMDLTIKIRIGDAFVKTIEVPEVPINALKRTMWIESTSATIKIKETPEETTTVLRAQDFLNGATEKTFTTGNPELITAGAGNLDNVVIEGVFNIPQYTDVQIGSARANDRTRLQIRAHNHGYWVFQLFVYDGGTVTTYGGQDQHATSEVGYALGTDMPVKISVDYTNRNYVTGLADATIKFNVGDVFEKTLEVPQLPMSALGRNMYINSASAQITVKEKAEETQTVLSIKDFMDGDSQTIEKGKVETLSAGEGTLDGVVIDGIFNIAKFSNVRIGSAAGYRLHMAINNNELLTCMFATANAVPVSFTLNANEIGSAYMGQDIRIKVAFEYTKKNYVMGTATVTIKLNVGNAEKELVLDGVAMTGMTRTIYAEATDQPILLKACEEYYDVATGYELNGENITVNEQSTNAEALTAVGDYFVRCAGEDAYAKYVILWKTADAYVDNAVDVLDLVAIRNASKGSSNITSKAGNKAADVDGSGAIDAADCAGVRNILAGAQ